MNLYDSWTVSEEATGQNQAALQFEIASHENSVPKMASLVELLEFDDTETFKTLFNDMMANDTNFTVYADSNIYVTKVDDDYIADIQSWTGYLIQMEGFEYPNSESMRAVGQGVLYTMSASQSPQTFCDNTVCSIWFSFESLRSSLQAILCIIVSRTNVIASKLLNSTFFVMVFSTK